MINVVALLGGFQFGPRLGCLCIPLLCVLLISTACLTLVESTLVLELRLTWTTMLISAIPTTVSTRVTQVDTLVLEPLHGYSHLSSSSKLVQGIYRTTSNLTDGRKIIIMAFVCNH